ncbi:hypothetical protein [Streptomyces sp. NPDC085937]|uniref:hypothetical protein n=1 Tax=Streptomyces sp. NPDC085937 TaxID=3365742 RepID=UPI0037CD00C8
MVVATVAEHHVGPPTRPPDQARSGSGNNGAISDHSSSDTMHGREFLFPTNTATSI